MTGMFEAYPVEESRAASWIGLVPCRARVSANAFPHALYAWSGDPRGRCVRTWRAHFYRGIDFRSKSAERQHDNWMFANHFFLFMANFEHILLVPETVFLYLYFCVRLRFSIRRCFRKQTNRRRPNTCRVITVTSTAAARLCFSYDADSPPLRAERI